MKPQIEVPLECVLDKCDSTSSRLSLTHSESFTPNWQFRYSSFVEGIPPRYARRCPPLTSGKQLIDDVISSFATAKYLASFSLPHGKPQSLG